VSRARKRRKYCKIWSHVLKLNQIFMSNFLKLKIFAFFSHAHNQPILRYICLEEIFKRRMKLIEKDVRI
jgi:hypothetical protein